MLQSVANILKKTIASKSFWVAVVLCLAFTSLNPSPAAAGYDCPKMQVLQERYKGDCFPCQIVNVLLSSFMKAAGKVYDVSKEAGNKLLFLGTFIWLAFWALRKMSSLTNVEPASMTNELVMFLSKVVVAYCFINAGIGTLVSYAINPILGAGAEFGTELLLESENMDLKAEPKSENSYTGPTEIVSKSVMDKILKLSEGVSNEVANNLILGNALTCYSIQRGFHWTIIIKIHIPDIWLWLCGAAIWCAGFMLVLSVCYYLIDIPFKLGFAIIALPVVIGLWPFKMTAGKLKAVIMVAVNAAGTFLFLALSASYAMRLINESFSTVGGLPDASGNILQGTAALYYAFEKDNVRYVNQVFSITSASFLIIIFCYIYGIKLISKVTESYPDKFFGGSMTAGAGSPLHQMATAATMWAGKKAAAPFKMAGDIVAHQAGKAATTVAKAGANTAAGLVGAGAGVIVSKAAKFAQKRGQKMVDKAQDNKDAWQTLSQETDLHQGGVGAKIANKFGRMKANLQMGVAKTVAKTGDHLDTTGEALKAPGRRTLSRVTNALHQGGDEIGESLGELVGQLPGSLGESIQKAGVSLNQNANTKNSRIGSMLNRATGQVLGSVGRSIVNNQQQESNASQDKLAKAQEKFGESSRKLATYSPAFIGQGLSLTGGFISNAAQGSNNIIVSKLGSAFGNAIETVGNTVIENRPEENTIRQKIASFDKEKLMTVFTGKYFVIKGAELAAKVSEKAAKFGAEIAVNAAADAQSLGESASSLKENVANIREVFQERFQDATMSFGASVEGVKDNVGKSGLRHIAEDSAMALGELVGSASSLNSTVKGETGVNAPVMAAFGTPLTGVVMSGVHNLVNNTREAYEANKGQKVENLYDAAGTLIRPAFVTAQVLRQTASDTLEGSYQMAEKTMLAGIDVGLTLTAWAKTPGRAMAYGAYAVGDMTKVALTPVMMGVSTVLDAADVVRKGARLVTRPVVMTLGAVAMAPINFAAKAVDETLYAGYKMTIKPVVTLGTTAVHGANLLYRSSLAMAESTVAGQIVTRTFKAGGKTLKVGVGVLKLGRNIIRAAAGEGGYSNKVLTPEERVKIKEERKLREKEREQRKKDKEKKLEKERRELEDQEEERRENRERDIGTLQREHEAIERERNREETARQRLEEERRRREEE